MKSCRKIPDRKCPIPFQNQKRIIPMVFVIQSYYDLTVPKAMFRY